MSPAAPSLYFHTFWTRPQFVDPGRSAADSIELPDFEALTWLTSALEARRHGRLRLVTDRRGLEFIGNIGLDWVYNGGISTELDAIPKGMDPGVFWSAGKLYAWASIGEPAVSLDPDAICWRPVMASAPVVVLHAEDPCSEDYRHQQSRYSAFGFEDTGWDWQAEAMNAGVLMIADVAFARHYAAESIRFMTAFSRHLEEVREAAAPPVGLWADAMLFAEQRLLSLLLRRQRIPAAALAEYDPRRRHVSLGSPCLHLWGTKQFYPRCREARVAFVNHLIGHLQREFPEAADLLKRWALDRPLRVEQLPPDPVLPFPLEDAGEGYSCLGRIHGTVEIQDANLDVRRPGYPGARVGHAEILHPSPGTSFELTEVRRDPNPH
ncbi:MAG: hypothetical protein J0L84_14150 [Verrucomicrobia bacterium]|nr:hypothetical protein [Verrucomicrobiota bacterium]